MLFVWIMCCAVIIFGVTKLTNIDNEIIHSMVNGVLWITIYPVIVFGLICAAGVVSAKNKESFVDTAKQFINSFLTFAG